MVGRTESLPRQVELPISGFPIFESLPIKGFTKYPDFRGVVLTPGNNLQLFLLRPQGQEQKKPSTINVLGDTAIVEAKINGVTIPVVGHMKSYYLLMPEDSWIIELPATQAWGDNLDLVGELAVQFQVIQIKGGKHVGRGVALSGILNGESAEHDGGYDLDADRIDIALIKVALDHPEIFLDATCRGLQLVLAHLTQILPEEIPNHRSNTDEPIYHLIHNVVSELYGQGIPRVLFQLQEMNVNSYHNQGYHLETIRPFLAEWRSKYGIYVTHVSPDGIVEMMVRVNSRGRITALIKQFHIEKMGEVEGPRLRQLNSWIVYQALL